MAILTAADYPAIRAALDTNLDESSLPDSIIDESIYRQAADQDVLDRDPLAATRTGTDLDRVRRAAIFFCAARLAPAVIRITSLSITTRDLSYTRPIFDPEERAAELRALAEAELVEVLGEAAANRPKMFALKGGTRGK